MIRLAKAKPVAIVLACEKCFRRIGGKDRLTKPLKKLLKPQAIKLIRTRCLGVCPKNAVVLHDSRQPRQWLLIAEGTPAAEVAAQLVPAAPLASSPPSVAQAVG